MRAVTSDSGMPIVESIEITTPQGPLKLLAKDFDLLVGAEGVGSLLAQSLNPGLDRTTRGQCHTIITAVHDKSLSADLQGRFVKSYFADDPGTER
eukprot:3697299-Pyramimonas_sp.AAC.3